MPWAQLHHHLRSAATAAEVCGGPVLQGNVQLSLIQNRRNLVDQLELNVQFQHPSLRCRVRPRSSMPHEAAFVDT